MLSLWSGKRSSRKIPRREKLQRDQVKEKREVLLLGQHLETTALKKIQKKIQKTIRKTIRKKIQKKSQKKIPERMTRTRTTGHARKEKLCAVAKTAQIFNVRV